MSHTAERKSKVKIKNCLLKLARKRLLPIIIRLVLVGSEDKSLAGVCSRNNER